jgi:hypothetical protein
MTYTYEYLNSKKIAKVKEIYTFVFGYSASRTYKKEEIINFILKKVAEVDTKNVGTVAEVKEEVKTDSQEFWGTRFKVYSFSTPMRTINASQNW